MKIFLCCIYLGTTCRDVLRNCGVAEEATRLAYVLISCAWAYFGKCLSLGWWSLGVEDCMKEPLVNGVVC